MKIAIIGTGIAGLGCLWSLHNRGDLRNRPEITLFEEQNRLGGHTNTISLCDKISKPTAVDTGFIVYNEATYPNFIRFLEVLKVPTQASDMSFSVSFQGGAYEYASDHFGKWIGHVGNLFSIPHWKMTKDLLRFMKMGDTLRSQHSHVTMREFLEVNRFGSDLIQRHLAPMAAAIWSMAAAEVLDFPAASFGHFFHNHGLLEPNIRKRPLWRTITGGSQSYIEALLEVTDPIIYLNRKVTQVTSLKKGVRIRTSNHETFDFDHVVIASHADEAASCLENGTEAKNLLRQFHYSKNTAYVHSDDRLMPKRKRLWASWNYLLSKKPGSPAFISYWMNRLQSLETGKTNILVTLNPTPLPDPDRIWAKMTYHHPRFDQKTLKLQDRLKYIQGRNNIWFCGSYFGYGFHEDALASGLAVAEGLGSPRPWSCQDLSPAFANATAVDHTHDELVDG